MEKIKSAEDLRSVFVKAMISLYENDEKTYEQVENEIIALIEERDRQICDQQKEICLKDSRAVIVFDAKKNPTALIDAESILNAPYPEGIKKEENI